MTTYAITVESAKNGTVTSDVKTAAKGATVTLTVKPDKGYTLETITVTNGSGDKVKLTEKSGKYTFTMPASKVTVKATFMEDNSMLNFFVDVPADAYYYDAVLWAAEKGITGGTDAVHFSPNATCTRAQAVTFLWRAAGSPAPKSSDMPFTDVPAGSYYEQAVLWAMEQGITKGTSDTAFSPNATCSRAQIVTFLWRSQKSPAADTVNPFTDVAEGAWYYDYIVTAYENGLMTGVSETEFAPDVAVTRAMLVAMVYQLEGSPEVEGAASELFTDVADDAWYADALVWCSANGLLEGFEGETFDADTVITREDVAVMLYAYELYNGAEEVTDAELTWADASDVLSLIHI